MSGGSYDYLCFKDASELMLDHYQIILESMVKRLATLGYATDAAAETQHLLSVIRQATVIIDVGAERLSGVWRAVEWWDSNDSGEDGLLEALAEYRGPLNKAIDKC